MAFITRVTVRSGDRDRLNAVTADLKEAATRKGVEFNGPHDRPPIEKRVPLYTTLDAEATFGSWTYPVYSRELVIVGHDEFARTVAERSFPEGIHVSVEVERRNRSN